VIQEQRAKRIAVSKRFKDMNEPETEHNNHSIEPAQVAGTRKINTPQFSSTELGESNSLAKVRDLLFGNQMRDIEKKLTRLEERLLKECTYLRDETKQRLDSLEIYIKKEVESLTERHKNEQAEREQSIQSLVEEQKNIAISLEKKIALFDEQTANVHREIREQILNQSKSFQDDIRQKYEEILALLQQESQELQKNKTDRSTLANLFTELAIRLNSHSGDEL
jgi:hypothetical protein